MAESGSHVPRTVGRYQLYGELAAGGMATVHFGRLSGPVGFSRTVAIKRLHPQFAKDPEFVTMFLDEARLCGRIRHPNVVPTLDVVSMDGEIFIVMEYVPGEALSKLLKTTWQQERAVPPRVAASILSSVLHGLHAAHVTKDEHGRQLGIVHRDVSPQNVLVGSDGAARVLDFGVAKATGRMQTTRDGQVKGKIAYMPPEQLTGGKVSLQSDVYAAGVVLWETLAGRRLFDGETEAIVLVRAIEGRIEPPSAFNPSITPEIDAVVMRGLARDPTERYATAREFAIAIEQTIGIASPSEVGEWVDSVAHAELSRRAARIAEIESASVGFAASSARIGLAPNEKNEKAEVPSQVSSISVSRPAVSARPPPTITGRRARVLFAVFAVLGLTGIALGAFATQESWHEAETAEGAAAAATPRELESDSARTLTVLRSEFAPHKSSSSSDAPTPTPIAAQPRPTPAPVFRPAPPPVVTKRANCDPPYTVDPTTGRRKYKMECLK
jgi:serine/threonine protein kinase